MLSLNSFLISMAVTKRNLSDTSLNVKKKEQDEIKENDIKYNKIIEFSDDGTRSFFWRAHTITVLCIFITTLVYVTFFETVLDDTNYNTKRGISSCVLVFILLGVTVIPDGIFKRPHPAFWRLSFCCSIVYELFLIFILFQTKKHAIRLMKELDPLLGVPLKEKSYGGNCRIYDHDNPSDPFHNVWDKFDLFVPLHFVGWWCKTLILRDWWLCTVLSITFELLEYTLEHQLPNFSECWWDHWIMDAFVCNGLGIYLGLKTLEYFAMKTYHWRSLWTIPTYRGKFKRFVAQFGPYTWIDFDWKATSSLGRWLVIVFIVFTVSLADLNTFYLKFALWIPPDNFLNLIRLVFFIIWGAEALREVYQYLDDPDCTKIGRQAWMIIAIVSTEFLIVAKFDSDTISIPIPTHILIFWILGIVSLIVWTFWRFVYNHPTVKGIADVSTRRKRWAFVKSCELGSYNLQTPD